MRHRNTIQAIGCASILLINTAGRHISLEAQVRWPYDVCDRICWLIALSLLYSYTKRGFAITLSMVAVTLFYRYALGYVVYFDLMDHVAWLICFINIGRISGVLSVWFARGMALLVIVNIFILCTPSPNEISLFQYVIGLLIILMVTFKTINIYKSWPAKKKS